MMEQDLQTVKQLLWQFGEESATNRRKFVRQLRFPMFARASGTPAFEQARAECDNDFSLLMLRVEQECLRLLETFRMHGKLENHRDFAVPTSPIDLSSYHWKPLVSRWGGMVDIQPWLRESLQVEANSAMRIDHELLAAWFDSERFRTEDKTYAIRHPRVWAEALRIGDNEFYLARHLLDTRTRTYDSQAALWTPQADFLNQSCMMWAEEFSMDKDAYFDLVGEICPALDERAVDTLNKLPLPQVIDQIGIKRARLLRDINKFRETGFTSFIGSNDATTSGAALEAVRMGYREGMLKGNLLGGPRQDWYGDVSRVLQKMDRNLESFDAASMRTLSKLLAKGGVYGAGANVMSYQILGLDPSDQDKMDGWGVAGDAEATLEDKLKVPVQFHNHDMFRGLWDVKDGAVHLHPGTSAMDVVDRAYMWCQVVGHRALHVSMPMISEYIKLFRDLNKRCLRREGNMLWWKANGQLIQNIPFIEDKDARHQVRVKIRGYEFSTQVFDADLKYNREVAVNEAHSIDALARHFSVLDPAIGNTPVQSNHDALKKPLPFLRATGLNYTKNLVKALREFGPLDNICSRFGCKSPVDAKHYHALLDEIESSGACNMYPDQI